MWIVAVVVPCGPTYSARTSRRVLRRMIENSQRYLELSDRNPIMNVANYAIARTWAESSLHLASEEAIKAATGTDANHIIDTAQQKLDRAIKKINRHLPRRVRIQPDTLLTS